MAAITIQDLNSTKALDRQARLGVAGGNNGYLGMAPRLYAMQRMMQKFTRRFPLPFAFAQTLAIGVNASQVQYAFVQQTAIAIGDNNQIVQNATIVQNQAG